MRFLTYFGTKTAVLKLGVFLSYCFFFVKQSGTATSNITELNLGVLIPWTGENWDAGPRFASGVLIGIDRVNSDPNLIPGYKLVFTWQDSKCEESIALTAAVDMYSKSQPQIHALIGPACSHGCKAVGYLTGHWKIPLISYACGSVELSNKELFPFLARTVGVYASSGDIIVNLMRHYRWDRIALITSVDFLWTSIMAGVRNDVERNKLMVSYFQNFNHDTVTDNYLQSIFTEAKKHAHGLFLMLFTVITILWSNLPYCV